MVLYDLMPQDIARQVRGGRGSIEEPMYGELVREVDAAGSNRAGVEHVAGARP